jgi:hypothetical protein
MCPILGWSSDAKKPASRWNRAIRSELLEMPFLNTFNACATHN